MDTIVFEVDNGDGTVSFESVEVIEVDDAEALEELFNALDL